ncbi:MAG: hypothetical protein M1839_006521, partial [Geoglossum umbratile]
ASRLLWRRHQHPVNAIQQHSLSDLPLNILVTSRKEYDITQAFGGLPELSIKESDIAADVELYVTAEIEKRQRLKGMSDPVKSRIKLALVEGAHGMFRWVKCQLDVLCKTRTTKAIYNALQNLPLGLDETYERILAKIDEADVEPASRALTWITFSASPLKIEELVEAIAISPGQAEMDEELRLTNPSDIFDICGNLLLLTSETVGLAHYSVKEYLTSERISSKPSRISRFAVSKEPSHREITNTCLTYLSFKDFDSGPCWHSEAGNIELEGSFLEEISQPGSNNLSNLLEVTSYQDRITRQKWFEGRFYDDGSEGVLCTLVRFGFVSLATKLLDRGADVNAQGGRYGNVLQLVANTNNAPLVRLLLERGADVNAAGGYFGNALQAATIGGDTETIKVLLEWGADVNAQGGGLLTALQGAALNCHGGVVRLLLEHGADVNIIGGYHGTALRAAALSGNFEIAEMLLQHGADVNARDQIGRSALEAASGSGNYELVKMLLEHGAEVNPRSPRCITDKYGVATVATLAMVSRVPLTLAGSYGHGEIMRLLLDHGAYINANDNGTALAAVVKLGRGDLMEMLLAEGAGVDGSGSFAGNPLSMAMRHSHHELAQSLLKRGADPNGHKSTMDSDGPLLEAAKRGSEKDIRLLVESGANLNSSGVFTGSALHLAALGSDAGTVQLLLDLGADVNTLGGVHGSPFLASVKSGCTAITSLFLQLGASPAMPDCFGFNVGHYIKYGWCSLAESDALPDWPGTTPNEKNEVNLAKCKETIQAAIETITRTTGNSYIFETLGRGLLIYGMEADAITSLEQLIRKIGEEGVFVHPQYCDECKTEDQISGSRYLCKICWNYDLCKLCHENTKESHGRESGVVHEFVKVPGEG